MIYTFTKMSYDQIGTAGCLHGFAFCNIHLDKCDFCLCGICTGKCRCALCTHSDIEIGISYFFCILVIVFVEVELPSFIFSQISSLCVHYIQHDFVAAFSAATAACSIVFYLNGFNLPSRAEIRSRNIHECDLHILFTCKCAEVSCCILEGPRATGRPSRERQVRPVRTVSGCFYLEVSRRTVVNCMADGQCSRRSLAQAESRRNQPALCSVSGLANVSTGLHAVLAVLFPNIGNTAEINIIDRPRALTLGKVCAQRSACHHTACEKHSSKKR